MRLWGLVVVLFWKIDTMWWLSLWVGEMSMKKIATCFLKIKKYIFFFFFLNLRFKKFFLSFYSLSYWCLSVFRKCYSGVASRIMLFQSDITTTSWDAAGTLQAVCWNSGFCIKIWWSQGEFWQLLTALISFKSLI